MPPKSHGNMSNSLDKSNSDKRLVIGVDEAGYGPNLGPLVIAASAWEIPNNLDEQAFCKKIAKRFHVAPFAQGCLHIPLGDSKQLYSSSSGLTTLETGLLALTKISSGNLPETLCQFLRNHVQVLSTCDPDETNLPWYDSLHPHDSVTRPQTGSHFTGSTTTESTKARSTTGESITAATSTNANRTAAPLTPTPLTALPLSASLDETNRLADLARTYLNEDEISCLGIQGEVITESHFNRRLDTLGSKGQLLSIQTLQLVLRMLNQYAWDYSSVEVFCDRQGGRKNYMPILVDVMPDFWFQEMLIGKERCSYRCQDAPTKIDIHFSIGGDRFPPTALASMMAKYLRERLMGWFNAFWIDQIPDIKPTAGYPVDAKRFRSQIESRARELGLDVDKWWRRK